MSLLELWVRACQGANGTAPHFTQPDFDEAGEQVRHLALLEKANEAGDEVGTELGIELGTLLLAVKVALGSLADLEGQLDERVVENDRRKFRDGNRHRLVVQVVDEHVRPKLGLVGARHVHAQLFPAVVVVLSKRGEGAPQLGRVNVHVGVGSGLLLQLAQTKNMPSGNTLKAGNSLVVSPRRLDGEFLADCASAVTNVAGSVTQRPTRSGRWRVDGVGVWRGLERHDLVDQVVERALCGKQGVRVVVPLTVRAAGVRKSEGRMAASPWPAPASDLVYAATALEWSIRR